MSNKYPLAEPYDLNALVQRMKVLGLDLAEDSAGMAVKEFLEWIGDSAALSPTPIDDVINAMIPVLKPHIDEFIDMIDGEVDPKVEA